MSKPLISVIVLTYNHENWISDTLNSLISDPYPHLEIILYNNGSSDRTIDLSKQILHTSDRDYFIFDRKTGVPINEALNEAIKKASGEFICFIPGDDISIAGRFDKQLSAFEKNPELEIMYANGRNLIGSEIGQPVHNRDIAAAFDLPPDQVLEMLFRKRGVLNQTMLVKRSLLLDVGGYDETSIGDDWILNIRIFRHLTKRSQYGYLDEDTFLYRRHEGGLHRKFRRHSDLIFETIEKYFPWELKKSAFAENYFERAQIGFKEYGRMHWFLAFSYLLKSLWHGFSKRRFQKGFVMAIYAALNKPIPKKVKWKHLLRKPNAVDGG